jgi:prepilin-type N-terminal cleavage/methylation domain-containing protein
MPTAGARALTLIELLAVIVIASLVLAVGGWSLGATSERTVLARTIANLQQIDARARLHARSSCAIVVLQIEGDARVLRLATVEGDKLSKVSLPLSIAMTIEKPGGPNQEPRLVFNARGHSTDYVVTLRTQHEVVRFEVHGLSGEIVVSREVAT